MRESTARLFTLPRRVLIGGIATVSLWVFIAGYGAFRLREAETTMRAGPVLTVVQPDIPTSTDVEILEGFDPLMFREQMLTWSTLALSAQPRPAIVVWPEAMSTMPPLNPELLELATIDSPTDPLHSLRETGREWEKILRTWVDKSGVPLLTGGPVWIPAVRGEAGIARSYNAATIIEPGTAHLQRQPKMRLFPVGEFMPWEGTMMHDWLDRWINRKVRVTATPPISPGERREIFELKPAAAGSLPNNAAAAFRYAICLCSEILFSETSTVFLKADGARKPVDFLINISNDGFLQRTEGQMIHFHVLPFRAVEARIGIARSSNTGVSGFVKPTGEIYGEVVNARGEHWTGRGAPELPLIAELVKFRAEREHELAGNPALASRVREMIARIEALRQEAGVTGQSTQPVSIDSRRTLYSRSDDWFAKTMFGLLLLGLAGAAISPAIGLLSRLKKLGGRFSIIETTTTHL
jgi:apolipoprotein N-acyltransferase